MPPSAPSAARWMLPLLIAAGVAAPAFADDRCTGTLCDFYYGGPAPEQAGKPARPAPATPLTVPSGGILGFFGGNKAAATTPAPAGTPAPSRLQVQGGGLAAMARGEAPDRCTGTLCDLFYGGPPPERPAAPAAVATPVAADEPAEAPLEDAAPRRRAVPREPTPSCVYDAHDPWRCYRR